MPLLIFTVVAALPIGIWIYILFKKGEKSKKTVAKVFAVGCLTAPTMLLFQYLWIVAPPYLAEKFPQIAWQNGFDLLSLSNILEHLADTTVGQTILLFVFFGVAEEIIKHYVVSTVDKRTLLINKINDALKYSLLAALGFAFTENIYYFYTYYQEVDLGGIIGLYIFRSIFTAAAHMIFSGIFGYYYGIGKFAINISAEQKLAGKSSVFSKVIGKIFNLPVSHAYQQQMILKGLLIATVMHAIYNYLLESGIVIPVILFVIGGFLFLQYLLKRKAGHLVLTSDITEKRKSTLAKKDEDVVIELLGMWIQDKRYVDVIHICERLLERDPDNNVVKLFKAKAMDSMTDDNVYKKILSTVIRSKDDISDTDKSVINKYLLEKNGGQKTTVV